MLHRIRRWSRLQACQRCNWVVWLHNQALAEQQGIALVAWYAPGKPSFTWSACDSTTNWGEDVAGATTDSPSILQKWVLLAMYYNIDEFIVLLSRLIMCWACSLRHLWEIGFLAVSGVGVGLQGLHEVPLQLVDLQYVYVIEIELYVWQWQGACSWWTSITTHASLPGYTLTSTQV